MSLFDTLFGKLKSVLHIVAQDVRDVGEKIVDRVEDKIEGVKEKVERHFDISMEEVERRLDVAAAGNPQKLNWRESDVDLLKLLEMDSSKPARKVLASEFNPDYGREFTGTGEQNVWLHKQIMAEIAKRGIPIPQPA